MDVEKLLYASIRFFKSAEVKEREMRINAVFFGVKIQGRCVVVHVVKCDNVRNCVMAAQIQLMLHITSLINLYFY